MADYNVYIHAVGTGTQTAFNPTTPWSQREGGQTSSQNETWSSKELMGAFKSVASINPTSIASSAVDNATSIIPAVAIAGVVAKASFDLLNASYSFYVDYIGTTQGDYSRKIHLNDLRQFASSIRNPIGFALSIYKTHVEWSVSNKRSEQERTLLGDSVINAYTNRGV